MNLRHDQFERRLYAKRCMRHGRISAGWLSDEMAHALAAMCPPLKASDVLQAADELSSHADVSPVGVGQDVDPVNLRKVVEALHALHDLVP
jgi:hypothetical protein